MTVMEAYRETNRIGRLQDRSGFGHLRNGSRRVNDRHRVRETEDRRCSPFGRSHDLESAEKVDDVGPVVVHGTVFKDNLSVGIAGAAPDAQDIAAWNATGMG
jgi:hypothetical protein